MYYVLVEHHLFFAVTTMTGSLIDLLVRRWNADWLQKLVMRFGVGLAAISVVGDIFNLFGIPLDYRLFLGLGGLTLQAALILTSRSPVLAAGAPALSTCI